MERLINKKAKYKKIKINTTKEVAVHQMLDWR